MEPSYGLFPLTFVRGMAAFPLVEHGAGVAAGGGDGLAGDAACLLRAEEYDDRRDLLDRDEAADGVAAGGALLRLGQRDALALGGAFEAFDQGLSPADGGVDGVDGDALGGRAPPT